jgi:hypothetical protein
MAITDLIQYVECSFDIAASGGNDTFTIQNLTNTLRIVGATVTVGDNAGLLDPTVRRDQFLVDIAEGGKISLGNAAVEAFALRDLTLMDKFPSFVLDKNSQTVVTVTHDPVNAAVLTAPYVVRITFLGVPTDTNQG